jgi:DNA-directed RNA polymerase subunit RPC12/RpoP
MFKSFQINFANPICTCEVENLAWTVVVESSTLTLSIKCNDCGVKILIPHKAFQGKFVFDNPYPETKKKMQEETLKALKEESSRLIEF